MAKNKTPLATGIHIIHGLPRGGKTYYSVGRALDLILDERRPVYTNLPIRWRVMRRFLQVRGLSPALGNYIIPLTAEHFQTFVDRWAVWHAWQQDRKLQGHRAHIEDFEREHGPNIWRGEGANWIAFGAAIIIDEAHEQAWMPGKNIAEKTERAALHDYAAMHGHSFHHVMLVSQYAMDISHSWRARASRYIVCIDKSELPLFAGIRLPLKVLGVGEYPGVVARGNKPPDLESMEPLKQYTVTPAMNGFLRFRLYNSHTHAGSPRRAMRQLADVRAQLDGEIDQEEKDQDMSKDQDKPTYVEVTKPRGKWGRRLRLAFVLFLVIGGFLLGQVQGEKQRRRLREQLAAKDLVAGPRLATGETVSADARSAADLRQEDEDQADQDDEPSAQPGALVALGSKKLTGVGRGFVFVEGRRLDLGSQLFGYRLIATDHNHGTSIWSGNAEVVAWRVGSLPVGQRVRSSTPGNTGRASPAEDAAAAVDPGGPGIGTDPGL